VFAVRQNTSADRATSKPIALCVSSICAIMNKFLILLLVGVLLGAAVVRASEEPAADDTGADDGGADLGDSTDTDLGSDEADAAVPEDFQAHEEVPAPDASTLQYKILWGTEADALAALDQLNTNTIDKVSVTAQMKKLINEDAVDPTSLINCTFLHFAAVMDYEEVAKKGKLRSCVCAGRAVLGCAR